jgi:hypothetical protein
MAKIKATYCLNEKINGHFVDRFLHRFYDYIFSAFFASFAVRILGDFSPRRPPRSLR